MKATRRRFLKTAATAAGAAAAEELAQGQEPDHDHEHQAVPSDLTLRVKSLESLLVEKGLVGPGSARCPGGRLRAQDRSAQRRQSRSQGLGGPCLQAASSNGDG